MDELIRQIQERTGLSPQKATEVVGVVLDHLRSVLPDGVVDQLVGGALGAAGTASELTEGIVDAAKGLLGGLTGDAD